MRNYRLDNKRRNHLSDMPRVIVSDPIHQDAISFLKEKGIEVVNLSADSSKLSQELSNADGLIVRSATKVTAELLEQGSNLKIIGRAGVGLDNIDLDACNAKGVKVVNSPEGPTRSVAELSLGLMIAVARKFGVIIPGTKSGEWPKKEKGLELFGKTLGIIGSGAIGGTFAKYAIAIGMKVIAYDIIEYEELKGLDNFEYTSLENVVTQSDVISVHVPLIPATHHMISKESFDKMKPGVLILNASRGGIIDEEALYVALQEGKVGGVGLDVYEDEPAKKSSPLVSHPLVITTPHIGAQTPEASRTNSMIVAKKVYSTLT